MPDTGATVLLLELQKRVYMDPSGDSGVQKIKGHPALHEDGAAVKPILDNRCADGRIPPFFVKAPSFKAREAHRY